MLRVEPDTGQMCCPERDTVFADRPYVYSLSGSIGEAHPVVSRLGHRKICSSCDRITVTATFEDLEIELRQHCPDLVIECHDPIWPWNTSLYVPTCFRQGSGEQGTYDENWGFEYMWYCIDDLKSGKALALYDYNLACSIPLYLHITMAALELTCKWRQCHRRW